MTVTAHFDIFGVYDYQMAGVQVRLSDAIERKSGPFGGVKLVM